jgi:hypothetical protein
MYPFSCLSWEYNISQNYLKFKTFGMKFGHLEQKLDLRNQNISEKFLKNNAHIQIAGVDICYSVRVFSRDFFWRSYDLSQFAFEV